MLPPIIDSHVHWRDPITNPYEELTDSVDEDGNRTGSAAPVYLPADYLADIGEFEIAGVVHIEAEWLKSDPIGETSWLHKVAADGGTQGLPLVVVGYCDLSLDNAETVLEAHAAQPLTRGIRHILNRVEGKPALCWADRNHLEDPKWQDNYALLGKYGIDFDLMCFGHQIPAFVEICARSPEVPVHLEHAALPWDHSPEGKEQWRDGMRALAALDHADVKISGLGNTVSNWTTESIRPYVLETIEIFGTKRVSFASNFPTDKQFSDMPKIWRAFDEITADFSTDERADMFAENARRLYRMPK